MKYKVTIFLLTLVSFNIFSQASISFNNHTDFNDGYALVRRGKLWAVIDTNGVFKTDFTINHKHHIEYPQTTDKGYIYCHNDMFHYTSFDGTPIFKNSAVLPMYNDNHVVYLNEGYKIIDTRPGLHNPEKEFTVSFITSEGKLCFTRKIRGRYIRKIEIRPIINNYAVLKVGEGKFEIINKQGVTESIITCIEIGNVSEGLIKVKNLNNYNEEKWGFMDTQGNLVIDYKFRYEPGDFRNGYAQIQGTGLVHGFTDRNGDVVIEPKYNQVFDFQNELCVVKLRHADYSMQKTEGYCVINKQGEIQYSFGKYFV